MLTEEQLKAIEDCGSAEMPLDETAIIAECSLDELSGSKEALAKYRRGHLLSKMKIRQAVVKMAREGVPQMVKIYQDFAQVDLPTQGEELDLNYDLPDLDGMVEEE